jgi:hypothetical protein
MGWAVPPPRPVAGQASAEYVALLAVVGVALAGAAAVGSVPALAAQVAGAVRHGICLVAGGICSPGAARAAGLAPCLVHARAERERLGGRLLVVRLGRGDALLVERRSDGSAAVSFADGGGAGASLGVGLQLLGHGAKARGGAGLQFTAGRTWEFPTFVAAARFVRRWGRTETLTGEVRGILPGGDRPPPPDSRYIEGGGFAEFAAALGGPAGTGVGMRGEVGAVAGRRVGRDGREIWYDRVDAETAGRLGLVLGAIEEHHAGEAALEVTVVRGRPVELRLRAAARVHGELAPPGPVTSMQDLSARLRRVARTPGGHGRRLEAEVSLDLTDPANRRALVGVVDVLRLRVAPADWDDRVRALAARLDADGAVDVRLLRVGLEERDLGADAALGLGVGASYDRTEEVRDLMRAWSLRAGGTLQEREDCVPA